MIAGLPLSFFLLWKTTVILFQCKVVSVSLLKQSLRTSGVMEEVVESRKSCAVSQVLVCALRLTSLWPPSRLSSLLPGRWYSAAGPPPRCCGQRQAELSVPWEGGDRFRVRKMAQETLFDESAERHAAVLTKSPSDCLPELMPQ